MRKLLAVTIGLLVCAPVWASRGRPVSDLRFEGNVVLIGGFVASDGKDFLCLSNADASFNHRVYVQRVSGGNQVGPGLNLGAGTAAGIAWTGSDYLVAWSTQTVMWTAHVSRQGALIEGSAKIVMPHPGWFGANTHSALVVGRLDDSSVLAQLFDLTGRPSSPAVTISMPNSPFAGYVTVSPSGSGYAILSTGYSGTFLQQIGSDGSPLSGFPISLEGPYGSSSTSYHSDRSAMATDGTDTLILFAGEKFQTDTELKTVIVGPDGTIKRPARTAFTMPGAGARSLQPASVVWTGSEYVVALGVSKDPTGNFTNMDTGLLRISRSGDAIGDLVYTTSGDRRKLPIGLGWNGSQLLVPWWDGTNQGSLGSYCVSVPIATMIPSAPAALGRALSVQSGLTLAASDGQYLAAWFETGAVATVRASRIDGAGNFLDGAGIVLATLQSTTGSLAIDSDGANWLVVWTDAYAARGRRVSRSGSLPDAQPFLITYGSSAAVRWNGSNYVVVAGNASLSTAAVSREGVVTASRELMPSKSSGLASLVYDNPSLVVVGGEAIAVYLNVLNECAIVQPVCWSENTIVGWRLDSSGNPVGAAFTIAQNVWPTAKLATDGTHHLLAWSAFDTAAGTGSVFGTVLSEDKPLGGAPFRIASKASLRDVAFDGNDFLVAFQDTAAGIVRVAPTGAVNGLTWLPLDDGESMANPTLAAGPGMPALVGYLDTHPAYDTQSRGALLFSSELTPSFLTAPFPPSVSSALRLDQNTIDVRWQPSAGILGIAVELQLEDGAFRTIGVAAGGASSGRFSLAGLQGSAIRLRSWNAAGLSEASTAVPIALPRQRSVR